MVKLVGLAPKLLMVGPVTSGVEVGVGVLVRVGVLVGKGVLVRGGRRCGGVGAGR